jgi:hypothetical protein
MPQIGFRADGNNNVYVYIESADGGSAAVGMTASDNNRLHVTPSTTTNVSPSTGSPMLVLDPRTGGTLGEGDIVLLPKGLAGSGNVVVQSGTISQPGTTSGVLQVDGSAQGLYFSSKGTDGQLLVSSSTGVPTWANVTAGTGISITNGHNSITIAANGSTVLETITGNTGGAISPTAGNINIKTSNATVGFSGSGSTLTQNLAGDSNENLALGSSLPSQIAGCINNTGFGYQALNSITSGSYNTAIGQTALFSLTTPQFNTALGQAALSNLVSGSGSNVAIGNSSGGSLTNGAFNTFVGFEAGDGYFSGGESSNISIGTGGGAIEVAGASNTLVIGKATGTASYNLASAYICGIDGVNVGSVAKVVTMAVGSTNQLGTATLTAGTGIAITPSANAITVTATGMGAFSWVVTAGGTASVNTGYFTSNGASLVTITLPSTANVGDTIRVSGLATGGWEIAQNAGQSINIGSSSTTTGVSGSLASTAQYDAVELVCCVANNTFNVVSAIGNITII